MLYHLSYDHRVTASLHNSQYHSIHVSSWTYIILLPLVDLLLPSPACSLLSILYGAFAPELHICVLYCTHYPLAEASILPCMGIQFYVCTVVHLLLSFPPYFSLAALGCLYPSVAVSCVTISPFLMFVECELSISPFSLPLSLLHFGLMRVNCVAHASRMTWNWVSWLSLLPYKYMHYIICKN